jgi:phage tail-like protein
MASAPLPLLACSFLVTVNGETIAFAEATGLTIEREQSTYKHGLSEWEGEVLQTYRSPRHQRLSLKRAVFGGDTRFFDWLMKDDAEERAMDLAMIDATGGPALIWRIKKAVPVKISGPSLVASSNEVALETLELMVAGVSVELP